MIHSTLTAKASGHFGIKVLRADGSVKQELQFDNLLLDSFFSMIQNKTLNTRFYDKNKYCLVGTGTSTPTAAQTGLDALLSTSPINSSVPTIVGPYAYNGNQASHYEYVFTWALGAVVGNLTEIGIRVDPQTGNTTFCRALITDGNGDPTTVTVTAEDQLVVTYQLILSNLDATASGTVDLEGVTYNWTSGRMGVGAVLTLDWLLSSVQNNNYVISYGATSTFGGFNVTPTTQSGSNAAVSGQIGLVPGESRATLTASISQFNATGGIKCIQVGCSKFSFTPVIPKTSAKTLSLTVSTILTR